MTSNLLGHLLNWLRKLFPPQVSRWPSHLFVLDLLQHSVSSCTLAVSQVVLRSVGACPGAVQLLLNLLILTPHHCTSVCASPQVPFPTPGHGLLLKWLCLCLGKLCQDNPEVGEHAPGAGTQMVNATLPPLYQKQLLAYLLCMSDLCRA
jgi:hypothetical protein